MISAHRREIVVGKLFTVNSVESLFFTPYNRLTKAFGRFRVNG